jgi:hypothetical protein
MSKQRKHRRWDVMAMRRAFYAWTVFLLIFLMYLAGFEDSPTLLPLLGAILAVSAPAAATSAIIYGHRARLEGEAAAQASVEQGRGIVAVILGHFWWLSVCMVIAHGPEGILWFGLVVALIELPRILYEKAGARVRIPLACVLLLGSITWITLVGGRFPYFVPGIVGTLELVALAAWWPFSRRTARSNRDRILVGVLLYVFAAMAVFAAYTRVRSLE